MFGFKQRKRRRLRETPLGDHQRALLRECIPYRDLLDAAQRAELEGLVQVFLAEKSFEGCGGQAIDDEIRITIAGHACLLLLGRDTDIYPLLSSVLVYPDGYSAPVQRHGPDGTVSEDAEERIGESWAEGSVVISWRDVLDDLEAPEDGYSVIVHEFAHQLDDEMGEGEGVPRLPEPADYGSWRTVMQAAYGRLCADTDAGRPTLIDGYGSESPCEFFSVISECFFTIPVDLAEQHPELYTQLMALYRQDPATSLRRLVDQESKPSR